MSRWNPSNPALAGDEWFGSASSIAQIASLVGRGPVIGSNASESVTKIAALIRRSSGNTPVNVGVDVYDLASPVGPDTQSWVIAVPEVNLSNAAQWVKSSADVETAYDVNAHNNVDDVIATSTSLATGASDQLRYQGTNPATAPQIRFKAGDTTFYDGDSGASLGAGALTGKRICSVEVVAVVENLSTHSVQLAGQIQIGTTAYNADSGQQIISYQNPALERVRFAFYNNPATGLPWTNADAVALTDGTNGFGIAVSIKSGAGNFIVTALMLQFRVLTERRVATGYGATVTSEGWVDLPLLNPATNASAAWSKLTGHDYLLLYSLTRGSSPGGVAQVDTSLVAGLPAQALTDASRQAWSLDHGAVPLSLDSADEGQIASLLYVGASVSADSLPYGAVVDISAVGSVAKKQGISTHSTQSYGSAKLLVSRGSGGQTAALAVRLKTSDDSVLAGPVNIATTDVPADGKYHVVTVRFPSPAALTSGAAVYIEAVSASTVGWLLPVMQTRLSTMGSADATAQAAASAGIGGATDRADADNTRDYPWSIGLAPSPPGTLASSAAAILNRPTFVHVTLPTQVKYAHLTWAATSLGAAFGYYELQRQDADWTTIAIITTEASAYFNNIDCARNVALNYRIRVVRADGGQSAWATFPAVTVTTGKTDYVVIASDWDPALSLAFLDVTEGGHEWKQRGDDREETKDYYGRDYPVVWGIPEASGEEFTRDLLVAVEDPNLYEGGPITPDRAMFDLPLALFKATTVPCLVYCDGWGRRWNVAIKCTPKLDRPFGAYIARVTCTQVAVPDPVEVSVPWLP